MVKVSVILPVYNVERYLEQCLDSIVGQTLKDIEIICVDDGSTDNSLNILKNYQKKDSRIRLIEQKNAGAGAARNVGMRTACGQCLSFLDSDDFFEPDMLEKAYECLEQYQADFVVFDSDQFHMDKQEFVDVPWVFRKQEIPPYMPFSHRELTDNVFKVFVGWAWDKLYRRSFVEAHALQFQEQRTSNDLLFVFSAFVLAKRIAVVDQVLAHQRRGSSTSLSVTREKSWHCFYDALTALRRTYPDYTMRITRQFTDGEYVISEFVMRGTHGGLWLGIQPTGRVLEFNGVDIDRVRDGRIIEHGGAVNTFETLWQQGLIGPR